MAGDRTGLIHFRCVADGHQQGVAGRTADTLTVHEATWAFCPLDVRASGHVWERTGGVPIEALRRGSPTIDLDLDVRPRVTPAEARPSAKRPSAPQPAPRTPPAKPAPRKRTTR